MADMAGGDHWLLSLLGGAVATALLAWMLAVLFSIVLDFRRDNLAIQRASKDDGIPEEEGGSNEEGVDEEEEEQVEEEEEKEGGAERLDGAADSDDVDNDPTPDSALVPPVVPRPHASVGASAAEATVGDDRPQGSPESVTAGTQGDETGTAAMTAVGTKGPPPAEPPQEDSGGLATVLPASDEAGGRADLAARPPPGQHAGLSATFTPGGSATPSELSQPDNPADDTNPQGDGDAAPPLATEQKAAAAAAAAPTAAPAGGADVAEADADLDDWEGVETSELEDEFHLAAMYVSAAAAGAGRRSLQEVQLLLYALYKQATVGPCNASPPSVFNLPARAKWDAWRKLGQLASDEAMLQYIALFSRIAPGWNEGATGKGVGAQGPGQGGGGDATGGGSSMGPVFSTMMHQEGGGSSDDAQGSLPALHWCASVGDAPGLLRHLEAETAVNARDEEGRTALHYAADRGHVAAVRALLAHGAAVDATDAEGQTALHYAAVCEHEELAGVLLTAGANPGAADGDGATPEGLRPRSWVWGPSAAAR